MSVIVSLHSRLSVCLLPQIQTSHLLSQDGQTLPQTVEGGDRSCVVVPVERKHTQIVPVWLNHDGSSLKSDPSKDVSHSGRLPIAAPVVCQPAQIQEERHRLRPPVEYFLTVDTSNIKGELCNFQVISYLFW